MSLDRDAPLRIHWLSKVLARTTESSAVGGTVAVAAVIRNPSRRLSVMYSIAFEPDKNTIPASHNGAVWSARAVRRNRQTSKAAHLHLIINAQALPQAYELDSAIREVLVTATLTVPLDGSNAAMAGNWVLCAEWEPNQPAMCEEEIGLLFDMCDVSASGVETTIPA